MLAENSFLGTGWAFPPNFDAYSKSVAMARNEQEIKESLQILLGTTPGERMMELRYGCDLTPLAFQRLDLNLKTFMSNNIKQAILRYEPRIKVTDLLLEQDEDSDGTIRIRIQYRIKVTNSVENLVYTHSFS